jgi:8-amino-3,8-dideoxy-alpha-D-manno-octulosonate transaminase
MSELQGAIGLAQLAKLDYIVQRQRANKAALMARLKSLDVAFRRSPDPDGDIGDTIVFYMPDRKLTDKFVAEMRKQGLGTKNLPDAIGWHFAKHWPHLFKGNVRYDGRNRDFWQDSAEILERSVAIPVMVKMDEARIDKVASTLLAIGKDLL